MREPECRRQGDQSPCLMAGRYWGGDIGEEGGDAQADLHPGHAEHGGGGLGGPGRHPRSSKRPSKHIAHKC